MNSIQLTAKASAKKSDIWGAIASSLCLIHCLATPFIFIAHAHTHVHAHDAGHGEAVPLWWHFIDYLFIGISFIAVYYSSSNTTLKWMPAALYTSWGLLTLFILNEKFPLFHVDHLFILFPALGLVSLHLYNQKYCNCEDDECCTP